MKNLLSKTLIILLASAGFMACQKESGPLTEKETLSSVAPNLGQFEFVQRGSNGAIVIYSSWITKTQNDWTGFGTHEITTSITAPSLSDAVKNSGAVHVYFEYDGNVWPLPHTWFDDVYSETVDYNFVKQKINLFLRFFGSDISGIGDIRFRYILIPGTQSGGRLNIPVDYNDYNAVCNYYGITK